MVIVNCYSSDDRVTNIDDPTSTSPTGNEEAAKILIDNHAEVDVKDSYGLTPFCLLSAQKSGNLNDLLIRSK